MSLVKCNLSLVICTRNRAPQLAESLQNLTRLQCQVPWELIVVDNGSKDQTQDVIKNFGGRLRPKTVIEPQPGLGLARNRGWALAQGEIVVFTDDDCYPADDFLYSVVQCFEEDPRLGFIGGRILLHDPEDYRITIQEQAYRQNLCPGEFIPPGLIHGANFACRRTALRSVKGFDERFGAGAVFSCGEDVDILARMSSRGWHGAYDPRPLVYHHHRRKSQLDVLRLLRQYARGRGAYYAKCILDPKLRMAYLRNWYGTMRQQLWKITAREVAGGIEFLVRSAAAQLYSIGVRRSVAKTYSSYPEDYSIHEGHQLSKGTGNPTDNAATASSNSHESQSAS
jgi:glycosyltransferase involved in cell wall biosynthesis